MTLDALLTRYARRDDVLEIQISNRVRRALGISKKSMQRRKDEVVVLNDELPGACLVCLLDAPRDNVLVSAFDEDGEAFARSFETRPRWELLGLR